MLKRSEVSLTTVEYYKTGGGQIMGERTGREWDREEGCGPNNHCFYSLCPLQGKNLCNYYLLLNRPAQFPSRTWPSTSGDSLVNYTTVSLEVAAGSSLFMRQTLR